MWYFECIAWGILVLGALQNICYFMQIPFAIAEIVAMRFKTHDTYIHRLVISSDIIPSMSIIIPAYNEEITIINTVIAALSTQYPVLEVIVVNDGSRDQTLRALIDAFTLTQHEYFFDKHLEFKAIRSIYRSNIHPNLFVIDKENGGRADALNAGISVSRATIFCTLDADSLLHPVALVKTAQLFLEGGDKIIAVGGAISVLNGCKVENGEVKQVKLHNRILPLYQVMEYIRAFLVSRLAYSYCGILTIISGAFSVFRRDIVIEAGGFNTNTIGEDFALVMALHHYCLSNKRPYEMRFIPDTMCWTEVPETMDVLRNQRIRWSQAAIEVFWHYRDMFMNYRYKGIGLVAQPLMLIFDLLMPLIELVGYICLPSFCFFGVLDVEFLIAFLCLYALCGVCFSITSLVIKEVLLGSDFTTRELIMLGFVAIVENFGYRQCNNLWRSISWWRVFWKKQIWGDMIRLGERVYTK